MKREIEIASGGLISKAEKRREQYAESKRNSRASSSAKNVSLVLSSEAHALLLDRAKSECMTQSKVIESFLTDEDFFHGALGCTKKIAEFIPEVFDEAFEELRHQCAVLNLVPQNVIDTLIGRTYERLIQGDCEPLARKGLRRITGDED